MENNNMIPIGQELNQIDLTDIENIFVNDNNLPTIKMKYWDNESDCLFLIKAMSNMNSNEYDDNTEAKIGRMMMNQSHSSNESSGKMNHIYDACLMGWKGFTLYHLSMLGHVKNLNKTVEEMKMIDIPYTEKNRKALRLHNRKFIDFVLSTANNIDLYKADRLVKGTDRLNV
jgi:hypothetical protein